MGKLHLCVGFYPNGSFKCNTVCEENLQNNIEYNSVFRPGRFYFVDGEYVCGGMAAEPSKSEFIEVCKQRIRNLKLKPDMSDSAPYV